MRLSDLDPATARYVLATAERKKRRVRARSELKRSVDPAVELSFDDGGLEPAEMASRDELRAAEVEIALWPFDVGEDG